MPPFPNHVSLCHDDDRFSSSTTMKQKLDHSLHLWVWLNIPFAIRYWVNGTGSDETFFWIFAWREYSGNKNGREWRMWSNDRFLLTDQSQKKDYHFYWLVKLGRINIIGHDQSWHIIGFFSRTSINPKLLSVNLAKGEGQRCILILASERRSEWRNECPSLYV